MVRTRQSPRALFRLGRRKQFDMTRKIKLTVNGTVFQAVLKDNALAENIAEMCPFSVDFTRSGDHEYYAALPGKPPVNGCTATTSGHRNGLYYFEDWNAFSIVFKDCDAAPYQIYHVGDFDKELFTLLEKSDGSVHVLCEKEEP